MSIPDTDSSSAQLIFSIIIPLQADRGQLERCWRHWNAQTVSKSVYEIILAVPPDFQDQALLNELSADCRIALSRSREDDLFAVGAPKARGKYLFFTEAHCWPEPDVLERCQEAIKAHPDWAGFTCLVIPVTHNRLSKAEASMYMADIAHAALSQPRALNQGFVTSRAAYEDSGGFKSGLGTFAEWAMGASYSRHGHKIGHFREAKLQHYYCGSLREVRDFTVSFVHGEMVYFDRGHHTSDGPFLEIPPEWMCQGNFDRATARTVLHIAARNLLPLRKPYRRLPWSILHIGRWIPPAIFGDWSVRVSAKATAAWTLMALRLAVLLGSQNWLNDRFRKYTAALITAQRLATIGMLRRTARVIPTGYVGFSLDASTLDATGFYPSEQFQKNQFRWSEAAAAVLVSVPAGPQRIQIDCIPVRDLSDARVDVRLYIDGVRIPSNQISIERDRISIDVNMARRQIFKLGWTCLPLVALADWRQLGLPIKRIFIPDIPTIDNIDKSSTDLEIKDALNILPVPSI